MAQELLSGDSSKLAVTALVRSEKKQARSSTLHSLCLGVVKALASDVIISCILVVNRWQSWPPQST